MKLDMMDISSKKQMKKHSTIFLLHRALLRNGNMAGNHRNCNKEIDAMLYVVAIALTSATSVPKSMAIIANPFHGMDSS